jgi:hypothetical protein
LAALIFWKKKVGVYNDKSPYIASIFMICFFHFFASCIGYGATSDGGILMIFSFMLSLSPMILTQRTKLTNSNDSDNSTAQTIAFVGLLIAGMITAIGIVDTKKVGLFYSALAGYAAYWAVALYLDKFIKYLVK